MKIFLSILFVFFMYSFSIAQCTCDNCGGSGWIKEWNPCVKCGASGVQSCDRCLGDGTELCKQCFGSGTVNDQTCISCDGYGEWVCGRCGGTGMEYCLLCGGEGYKEWKYPCGICRQTGEIPCP